MRAAETKQTPTIATSCLLVFTAGYMFRLLQQPLHVSAFETAITRQLKIHERREDKLNITL
jgi:hypothetical protein